MMENWVADSERGPLHGTGEGTPQHAERAETSGHKRGKRGGRR